MSRPTLDSLVRAPKALLHDHLDGGVRPATVVELADECGYTASADERRRRARAVVRRGAPTARTSCCTSRRSTTRVGVMQTRDALMRVAAECAEDLAADGVVYAEVRFAPELHTEEGLRSTRSSRRSSTASRSEPSVGRRRPSDHVYALVTAMRTAARVERDRRARGALARRRRRRLRHRRSRGRLSRPPATSTRSSSCAARTSTSRSTPARRSACRRSGRRCSAAAPSASATASASSTTSPRIDDGRPELGRLAAFVRDRRVPLEMCPTSNVHTGAAPSIAEHPIGLLRRLRFRVTVNTDNRLMSDTSMSKEFAALVDAFGYGLGRRRVAHDQRHEVARSRPSTSASASSTSASSPATPC